MKQLQFYKVSVILLLLLNIMMVSFFLLSKPPGPMPPRGQSSAELKRASDALKLDAQQRERFGQLVAQHKQKMHALNDDHFSLLENYFVESPQGKDSLIIQIQEIEGEKIRFTEKHFEDIRSILNPDQISYFQGFKERAIKQILAKNKKGPPPPKN